jgi:hypothetical protein
MKIKRKLKTIARVLLILVCASGAQAATVVLDKTDLMRDTEIIRFSFEILGGGLFKAPLTDFDILAPIDVLDLANWKGTEIVGDLLLGSEMVKFQAGPAIFVANFFGIAEDGSNLGLFRLLNLSLSRVNPSDEPIPTAALLILVGLIGLIALKGRRK